MTQRDWITGPGAQGEDPLEELRFALAEADAQTPTPRLLQRVRASALSERRPGRPSVEAEAVSGLETYRRAARAFDALLEQLDVGVWTTPALRGLDVQGLVGHLIGVEATFAASLGGDADAGVADHVASTDGHARAQVGRVPAETLAEWRAHVVGTIRIAESLDQSAAVTFYGITMPLDDLLVVRAFEQWIHEEDIRRAVGRELHPPDEGRLARMTALAMVLLPGALAQGDGRLSHEPARLVLTGPGGGTWDVPLDADVESRTRAATRIVVDAVAFCRVVGNRADLETTGAVVSGDTSMAEELFAVAAALALD